MLLSRWGQSVQSVLLFCGWCMHCKARISESQCSQRFLQNKLPQHSFNTLFIRQWKQLVDAWEIANKKLNKLHYYLKQVFNCFVALNLTIIISASAVDFVIILYLEDVAIHNKLGFLYSPHSLSPIFALTRVNRSFIIALNYCLKAIETHEKRPGGVYQLKDALNSLGSNPGSKMRPKKGSIPTSLVWFCCGY